MSTIFGVKDPNSNEIIEIASRGNGGCFIWLNKIAKMLPSETKVIPIDNTAQGIETIGDIRKEINEFNLYDDDVND